LIVRTAEPRPAARDPGAEVDINPLQCPVWNANQKLEKLILIQ
jgi:hypothetical protein